MAALSTIHDVTGRRLLSSICHEISMGLGVRTRANGLHIHTSQGKLLYLIKHTWNGCNFTVSQQVATIIYMLGSIY
jgi:hypothetical protein